MRKRTVSVSPRVVNGNFHAPPSSRSLCFHVFSALTHSCFLLFFRRFRILWYHGFSQPVSTLVSLVSNSSWTLKAVVWTWITYEIMISQKSNRKNVSKSLCIFRSGLLGTPAWWLADVHSGSDAVSGQYRPFPTSLRSSSNAYQHRRKYCEFQLINTSGSHIRRENLYELDIQVEGVFENTGQLPVVTIKDLPNRPTINITGGPSMPYRYKLHQVPKTESCFVKLKSLQVSVHFGRADEGEKGSEHTVDRVRFPAEIQLLAYNSDLYANFSVAMTSPRGLLAVSIIVDIGKTTTVELRRLTVASQSVTYKGQTTNLTDFQPAALLPKTAHYVTYEGSLTYPGCHETVTWVILNNPVYITNDDVSISLISQKRNIDSATNLEWATEDRNEAAGAVVHDACVPPVEVTQWTVASN